MMAVAAFQSSPVRSKEKPVQKKIHANTTAQQNHNTGLRCQSLAGLHPAPFTTAAKPQK